MSHLLEGVLDEDELIHCIADNGLIDVRDVDGGSTATAAVSVNNEERTDTDSLQSPAMNDDSGGTGEP
jgi:hypothetical protein